VRRVPQASKRVSRIETLPTLPEIDHPSSQTLAILTIPRLVLPFVAAQRERAVDLVPFAEKGCYGNTKRERVEAYRSSLTYRVTKLTARKPSGVFKQIPLKNRMACANTATISFVAARREPSGVLSSASLCSGTARAVRCFNLDFVEEPGGSRRLR